MPFMMGWLADTYAMRVGFVMPLICFLHVMFYTAFRLVLENSIRATNWPISQKRLEDYDGVVIISLQAISWLEPLETKPYDFWYHP